MRSSSVYEARVFLFLSPSAGGLGEGEDSGSSPVVFGPAFAENWDLVWGDLQRDTPLFDLHGPALSLHFFFTSHFVLW